MMTFELTPIELELKNWYVNHRELMPWELFLMKEEELKERAAEIPCLYSVIDPCYQDFSRAFYDKKLGFIDFTDMRMVLANQYISLKKQPRYFPAVSFESPESIVYYACQGNSTIRTGQAENAVNRELAEGDLFIASGKRQRTILCNLDDSILFFFVLSENVLKRLYMNFYANADTADQTAGSRHENLSDTFGQDLLYRTGQDPRIRSYMEQMLQEMIGQKQNYHHILFMTFQLLLTYTQREYIPVIGDGSRFTDTRTTGLSYAMQFSDYLQSHVTDFSLDAMAAHFHMSTSHLCRIYRKAFGNTILQTLQQYRIRVAKYMLLHTDESVDSIAFRIGYTDTSYFIEIFRKSCGCTPGKYRTKFSVI